MPLATLRDPQLVVESAAQALGADDGLVEHIADRSMLIVFDNFEQVVDAAPDVAALLSACPESRPARDEPGAAAGERGAGV